MNPIPSKYSYFHGEYTVSLYKCPNKVEIYYFYRKSLFSMDFLSMIAVYGFISGVI